MTEAKRLNLGAGETVLEGYEPRDAKRGDCIFPLPDPDGSVDEIYASHVLEHFPFAQVPEILKDWARVLKPGGRLRVAVPDFHRIAQLYLEGANFPVQAVVMGAQDDEHNFHAAIFDQEELARVMRAVGLRGIHRWHSEIKDAAALAISLNLAGYKPGLERVKIAGVMSVPRLGFMANQRAVYQLGRMGINVEAFGGAYWGQCLTRAMESQVKELRPEFLLTIDYDSVFRPEHVESLVELMIHHPEAAVLAPMQAHRGNGKPLMFIRGDDGIPRSQIKREELDATLLEVDSAHFGLTLIRVDRLLEVPRPWFVATPDKDGGWGPGKVDDDIHFWRQLRRADLRGFVTPRVTIGHMVERIAWPDINLETIYQDPQDFINSGAPEAVWR